MTTRLEYLSPDFDPTSLTKPQLRGILLAHNVGSMSNSVSKTELVQVFETHIRPIAQDILAKSAKVKPSNKGIKVVSEQIESTGSSTTSNIKSNPTTTKRSRVATQKRSISPMKKEAYVDLETAHPENVTEPPTKRLRKIRDQSDATDSAPTSERSARRRTIVKVEAGDTPPVKASRSRRVTSESPALLPPTLPPSSSRRRSTKPKLDDISDVIVAESEDDNPPPITTTTNTGKGKGKDTTQGGMTSRQNTPKVMVQPANDELADESEKSEEEIVKPKPKTPRRSQGEDSGFSDFNPFQSGGEEAAERERRRRKSSIGRTRPENTPKRSRLSIPAPSNQTPNSILRKLGPSRENLRSPPKEVSEALRSGNMDAAQEYNRSVQAKLNQITTRDVEEPAWTVSVKEEKPSILQKIAQESATACISRRTDQRLDPTISNAEIISCDTSALPLVPFIPRPEACAPCPPHAICSEGAIVGCEPEYLLSTNPFNFISPLVDGLPGVGPRAFPPNCKPDTYKKRMIGGLAKEIERDLAIGRGSVECAGIGKDDGRKGQGERFGMQEETLKQRYIERRDPKFSQEQFNDIFEAALKDLIEHGDVVESIDVHGNSWYAATRSEQTLTCQARLHLTKQVSRWRSELTSTMAVIALIAYLRSLFKGKREEKYRVEELVQVALRRLQDQERLHFVDPSTTPTTYIAPDQLRDLVMPPTSSTASRTKLWKKVADIVERNANVSSREREVNGEIWKIWEWTGVGERRVTWD